VPPEEGRLNARNTSVTPVTTSYAPNNTAAAATDGCGHARITTPRITAKTPDKIADAQMSRIRLE